MKRALDLASWPAAAYLALSVVTCPRVLFGVILFGGIWFAWEKA